MSSAGRQGRGAFSARGGHHTGRPSTGTGTLVAGWSSGTTALVTGGLLCVLAVTCVAAGTPELRDGRAAPPPDRT
ncbi:hypothetical protein [Streptomyces sp. NPDC098781]|uniref:hypothetical protein n=1 Tax=Streptomyces sp. NPDC098781 TaxID=3366097 RepID=UPI0038082B5C